MGVLNEFTSVLDARAIVDPSFDKCKGFWMIDGTLSALLQSHFEIPEFCVFSHHDLSVALGFWNKKNLFKHGLGEILNPDESNSCSGSHANAHRPMSKRL